MLIHHFGGREGLWVEVIRAVEERQRAAFAEVVPEPGVERRRRDAPVVAPHLRPVAVAERAALLRALRPGAAGPPGRGRAARRDRRRVARARRGRLRRATASRARRRSRRRGWASRSAAGCCSTCSRPSDREAVDAAMEAYIDLMDGKPGAKPTTRFGGSLRGHRCAGGPRTSFGDRASDPMPSSTCARLASGAPAATRALERRLGARRSSTSTVHRTPRVLARLDGTLSAPAAGDPETSRWATCAPTSPRSASSATSTRCSRRRRPPSAA